MKSDFFIAVHALVYLHHKACVVSSDELAKNICTNPARVRAVTSSLRKAGLIETKEGSVGGCRITADAHDTDLMSVALALDIHFVSTGWHSGDQNSDCLVSSGMGAVIDGIVEDLDSTCLRRLSNITIADIERQLFG